MEFTGRTGEHYWRCLLCFLSDIHFPFFLRQERDPHGMWKNGRCKRKKNQEREISQGPWTSSSQCIWTPLWHHLNSTTPPPPDPPYPHPVAVSKHFLGALPWWAILRTAPPPWQSMNASIIYGTIRFGYKNTGFKTLAGEIDIRCSLTIHVEEECID